MEHLYAKYIMFYGLHFMEYSQIGDDIIYDDERMVYISKNYDNPYNAYSPECHVIRYKKKISLKRALEDILKNGTKYTLAYIREDWLYIGGNEVCSTHPEFKEITLENGEEIGMIMLENASCYIVSPEWIMTPEEIKEIWAKHPEIKSDNEIMEENIEYQAQEHQNNEDFGTLNQLVGKKFKTDSDMNIACCDSLDVGREFEEINIKDKIVEVTGLERSCGVYIIADVEGRMVAFNPWEFELLDEIDPQNAVL